MPKGLQRYYGDDHLHFLTCSCYHRQSWLGGVRGRDLFLRILEEVRQRYRFVVVGYVVMPDHIHLLLSEPERGTPSTVMQVLSSAMRGVCCERRDGRPGKGSCGPRKSSGCGSGAFTISMSGASASGWRSCGICIAIR